MDGNEIVIVGYGGKFPGADNCEEFWRLLKNGENHVKDIPNHRWNTDAFYHEDYKEPGKTYVRKAGLIEGHDEWDNKMFQISDVEAARMDPQQRYTLDCVHMALENGGITRNEINGSNTGVFIGAMNDDYKAAINEDLKETNNYTLTGCAQSIIAARVSYVFNLLGPSMSIDTACSSSLVAIHTAIQAIKSGDCSMAICGGVSSILHPDMFIPLTKARMVSPTGQSQAFSIYADGYARGEGCGVVILMSLRQALKDGREIVAAIYTGVNQDGRTTTPITAPSGQQQISLLQSVYTSHNINPSNIGYIEAHEIMLKQTSRGWDHEVTVQIENHETCWLKWGPMPNKMRRSIPFSKITDVQTYELTNNFALIVETRHRRYIFKTNDKDKVRRLAVMLHGNSWDKVHRDYVDPVQQDKEQASFDIKL